jgi:uncharacterized 2Fe-2S/4Fe-4S cluster protein (DUF4445 family)
MPRIGSVGATKSPNPTPSLAVRFENLDRETSCLEGESVFHTARRAGIRIVGACGGRGACGTCMVRVISGETDSTPADSRRSKWQRACQVFPRSDCAVEVAPRSLARVVRADVAAEGAPAIIFDPAVLVREIALAAPTLAQGGADADRVLEILQNLGVTRIDLQALRGLPALVRAHEWRVRAVSRGDEVLAVRPPGSRALGLAVDLGTTNCAAYLLDLEAGCELNSMGIENPQASYGADLVSRMNHALVSPERERELAAAAATAVDELARTLCEAAGASTEDIAEIAVCGNTAMHHLLAGLPVRQLGRAPYVPAACGALDIKARDLGLRSAPGGYVHLMPNVGGYVGGDHVAVLLATEERWRDASAIVMDIGTNTEVSLVHEGEIRTVSCPSGPALEGGHISCGMRAAEGAIERVWLEDGRIAAKSIGDAEAVGLCGSGVIDAVAVLVAAGIVDRGGRLDAKHAAVAGDEGHRAAMIAPGVTLSQADIRAVQLAKAAIRCGIDMLLREAGVAESALERVILAGAFGAYLRVESAIAVGLLPELPLERFQQVGNAAGLGVRQVLASERARGRAQVLARRCRYLELGSLPGFQKAFLTRIGFDPKVRALFPESAIHRDCMKP